MSNVRAGVAYVDVRLGAVEQFKSKMQRSVESAVKAAEQKIENATKNVKQHTSAMMSGWTGSLVRGLEGIPARIAKVKAGLDSFSRSVGLASFQMQNFGVMASIAFTAPVAAALTLGTVIGVSTAAKIEQATAALRSMLGPGYDVEALVKRLQKQAIESPIFNTTDLITFTQQMTASGLKIKDTERFIASFGRIALRTGADISKIPFALQALVQMVGKGKVSMEELRLQLGDALPGAMKIVSDALGVTTDELYDMVKAGKLSGIELVKALTKLGETKPFLEGAAQGAQTMAAKWQALKEQVQTKLGEIFLKHSDQIKKALDRLGPTFDKLIDEAEPLFVKMIGWFEKLVEKVGKLIDWYKKLDPKQKDFINKLAAIAVVAGPAAIALGGILGSLAGLAAGLGLIATPAGLALTGIAGVGIALVTAYENSDELKERLKDLKKSVEENLIAPMSGPAKKSIDDLKESFKELTAVFDGGDSSKAMRNIKIFMYAFAILAEVIALPWAIAVGAVRGAINSIGDIVDGFVKMTRGWMLFFEGIGDVIWGFLTLDFQQMWDGLAKMWDGMWMAIISAGLSWVKGILEFVQGLVQGIWDFFKWLWDELVGHSIVPDIVRDSLAWFKKLLDGVRDILARIGGWFRGFYDQYISPFISSIRSGFNRALDFLGSIPGRIRGLFSNAGSWLVGAGQALVDGLVNGVRSMGSYLTRSILNLIPGAVRNTVANALGIHSPSRVFKEFGKFVVLGFVDGVQSTSSLIETAMSIFSPKSPPGLAMAGVDYMPSSRAALSIENYYASDKSDPRREAENWYFITTSRGGA